MRNGYGFISFHLGWVLGPFIHGWLQNIKTSRDTFGHGLTPLSGVYTSGSYQVAAASATGEQQPVMTQV